MSEIELTGNERAVDCPENFSINSDKFELRKNLKIFTAPSVAAEVEKSFRSKNEEELCEKSLETEAVFDVQKLLEAIKSLDAFEEVDFLTKSILNERFENCLKIYNIISKATKYKRHNLNVDTSLFDIFFSESLNNLISVYKKITEKSYYGDDWFTSKLRKYGVERVKLVKLDKGKEPLGVTITRDEKSDLIVINRVLKGGKADETGLLQVNDKIIEINGLNSDELSLDEIQNIVSQSDPLITFLLIPNEERKEETAADDKKKDYVRALFDYDCSCDPSLPCREIGLSFHKGDILQIVDQSDSRWWQAFLKTENGKEETLAGIIPSFSFQKLRTKPLEIVQGRTANKNIFKRTKNKPVQYVFPPYEYVEKYTPNGFHKRPIIFVHTDRFDFLNDLRNSIIKKNPLLFENVTRHTTRNKRLNENFNQSLKSIQRHIFIADYMAGRYIESEEINNEFYGTTYNAVEEISWQKNRICILILKANAIAKFRKSKLSPYTIFIKSRNPFNITEKTMEEQFYINEELVQTIYGHLFDCVYLCTCMEDMIDELYEIIVNIQNQFSWIPIDREFHK